MTRNELNRRDFTRLTAAAFGGLIAGSGIGCGGGDKGGESAPKSKRPPGEKNPKRNGEDEKSSSAAEPAGKDAGGFVLSDKHVCRGLNQCKNHKAGMNACAGQGSCATVPESSCGGKNDCRGQGGCGTNPAQNACKGKGGCHIPLMDDAWPKARAAYEKAMQAANKKFGPAPPAKG